MIFVTVGTNETAFDRLLEGVRGFPEDEEIIVQHGPSPVRPPGARCMDFLPFDRLVEVVREARVVVTHAGVGSIVVCLANGHRPIVVPRLHRNGEAVDDHQVPLCTRLAEAGLVTLVEDVAHLPRAVAEHGGPREGSGPSASRLADDLRDYMGGIVGRAR